MVMATQNPIEYEGTFPLPEAQLDRFLMRLHLGYPDASSTRSPILERQRQPHPIDALAAGDAASTSCSTLQERDQRGLRGRR